MKINYIVGDATAPVGDGKKFIVHCCNDVGGWGSGFVLALNRRWDWIQYAYRQWYAENCNSDRARFNADIDYDEFVKGHNRYESGLFSLGNVQYVHAEDDITIVNLIGQHRTGIRKIAGINVPPVDYRSIREGFCYIRQNYFDTIGNGGFSLHMPRMGCGLAGGKWSKILECLEEVFEDTGLSVTVYDYAPDVHVLGGLDVVFHMPHQKQILWNPHEDEGWKYPDVVYHAGATWTFKEQRLSERSNDSGGVYILQEDFTGDRK